MATDLVNTENPATGSDNLTTVAELRGLLDRYERDWHDEDWFCGGVTKADLAEVRDLRSRLRAVFTAADEGEAAGALNQILADVTAVPRISLHGVAPHIHFEPAKGRLAQWLGAAAAMGLTVVLCDHGLDRFGLCGSHDCLDVFVDTSKNRSRKHCSTSCTTRNNVAAFRRRRAGGSR